MTLAHLDSLPLMIWYSGLTAPFLFLLAKTASTYSQTALSVALRPLFPFQQAQYAQVFLLKPAPFCMHFAGVSSTYKSAISLLFYYLTLILSSPPCRLLHLSFYLNVSGRSGRNYLLSLSSSIRLQQVLGHSFLPRNDTADELARRGALLAPSAIPCSPSPFISCIHSCLFFDWRHAVSSKFSDTQTPSISTKKLVLPHQLTVSSLVYAATKTSFC